MAAQRLVLLFLLITAAEYLDANDDYNVSLSLSEQNCPYKPITARCIVKKLPNNEAFFLSWQCTGHDGIKEERLVLCDPGRVTNFKCLFGEVYDVNGDCNGTFITSNATFLTSVTGDLNLTCSNGVSEMQGVSASVKDLPTPTLLTNYSMSQVDDENYEITLWWIHNNTESVATEYILSVTNSSSPHSPYMYHATQHMEISLNVYVGFEYNFTIMALGCGGNLTSEPSNMLSISLIGTSTPTDQGETSSMSLCSLC
jgi:hypothetical protein